MAFLLGLLQAFLNGLVNIFWKKSVDLAKISKGLFTLYAKLVGLAFVFGFLVLGLVNYKIFFDWQSWLIMIVVVSLWLITAFIKQGLLKYNKLSVILPFDNLAPLFTIVLGYFIFSDSSFISFLISVVAVIVIVLFSIDYKNFSLPKKVGLLLFQQFLFAISTLLIAFVIKKYNGPSIAFLEAVVSIVILLIFTIKFSELKTIHKQSKDFYKYRIGAGIFGRIAYIINLFLISDLGIVLSTLLTFLTLVVSFILGYFFLNDKPTFKDISLAIIITFLVGLGMYFK